MKAFSRAFKIINPLGMLRSGERFWQNALTLRRKKRPGVGQLVRPFPGLVLVPMIAARLRHAHGPERL